MMASLIPLIPAKAGTQIEWLIDLGMNHVRNAADLRNSMIWVPAFAGMSGLWT
jgi:hypothetical protein